VAGGGGWRNQPTGSVVGSRWPEAALTSVIEWHWVPYFEPDWQYVSAAQAHRISARSTKEALEIFIVGGRRAIDVPRA
jgi:hypothetical protein